jgi:CBS domain-containing protein
MVEHQLDSLPVLDREGRLVGMVTQEQVLRWTTEQITRASRGSRTPSVPRRNGRAGTSESAR